MIFSAAFSSFIVRRRSMVIAMAAALGLLVLVSGAGEGLDNSLRSLRDGLRLHPASGEVHVVEIDARSLKMIHRWPLPRGVHAAAIERLREAGVRSIAFDVDFSTRSDPVEDAKLAAALRRAGGSVILPTFRQAEGSGRSGFTENVPIEPFAASAFLGAVNVVPDADSYVRRMLLGVETLGVPRPSLPSLLAEANAEIDRSFEIDFAIDPATIPRHSLVDLIAGKVPASHLAGKRVILGMTAIENGDRYAVPRYGVIPGVVIQALAAETLLSGKVPQTYSGFWPLALVLLLAITTSRPGNRARRAAIFAGGALAILMLPLVTEALFATTFRLAPALAAVAGAVGSGALALILQHYRERALTDPVTGLPNLQGLQEATAGLECPHIVVAHIDHFAGIASGLGSEATGKLVLRVADRLRIGDERCTIYRTDDASLAWVETREQVEDFGDRIEAINALMRAPVECGRLVDVSLSFGVASGGKGATQLVADALLAAQHAFRKGVRWETFTEAHGEETAWQLSLLSELDQAITSGQLWNAYQPKLDLRSGEIVSAEALVRWDHPERGLIPPDRFIPIVEEHGRARELTTHVLVTALDDALAWDRVGIHVGVAVNVSAGLLTDYAFIETVGQILQSSALSTDRVTIEITESAAMLNPDRAIAALQSWRSLGINISIDDYGTGQSSLNYLQKLPATELKVDKSFVQTIGKDDRNAIMVRSTVALAHELGMKVVAEGIEDANCLQLLTDMGCDTAQGFFIGRPMSSDAFAEFIASSARRAA